MHIGLNLRGVVEQDVENVVALVLIGSDDLSVHGDVVGDEGVGDDALFKPEILRGMAGVDGVDPGLELLPVGTGVDGIVDVVMPEQGHYRDGIGDTVFGFSVYY